MHRMNGYIRGRVFLTSILFILAPGSSESGIFTSIFLLCKYSKIFFDYLNHFKINVREENNIVGRIYQFIAVCTSRLYRQLLKFC